MMVRLTTLTTLCTTISLALCTMGVISHVGLGAAMPSVINDGDFYCEGSIVDALCIVPPTSTTLNIQSMVNSALAASNASASFYALRASFLGTLFINAPTSTSPAIPVHISIVNGSSHNSVQKGGVGFLVGFSGRPAAGSILRIVGGNYYEAKASVVGVLRVSATTLDPNTGIVVANVAVVGMMRLLEAYPIWLLSGSYIEICNCTSVTNNTEGLFFTVLTLSGASARVRIVNNSFAAISTSGLTLVYLGDNITLSDGAALELANNLFILNVSGAWRVSAQCCFREGPSY